MFQFIIGLVKDHEFVVECIDYCDCFECSVAEATEDLMLFNCDMYQEMIHI